MLQASVVSPLRRVAAEKDFLALTKKSPVPLFELGKAGGAASTLGFVRLFTLAAEKLFAQHGYHATIRQIADGAGVPLALVGYYSRAQGRALPRHLLRASAIRCSCRPTPRCAAR